MTSCSRTYTTKNDKKERNVGRRGTRGRGPERGAQQKRDSAHGRGRGGDSSGGAGDAKCPAGAGPGTRRKNDSESNGRNNGMARKGENEDKEMREAGRL